MPSVISVTNEQDVAAAVTDAGPAGRTLEITGQGTRREFGPSVTADTVLDLSKLTGITLYEPNELVITARAGTPIAEIQSLLASERQQFAFEPPDFGALWGEPPGRGTIGGALSIGLGGSRRVSAGAPRDHFLGFKAVNGLGESFAAGGRVVKNVTGFDLPKVLAGAFGTLGILTEVTLKVLPAPEATCTLCLSSLTNAEAIDVMKRAMASPMSVTGAAHLPSEAAARIRNFMPLPKGAATLLRLEGMRPVVDLAAQRLTALFRDQSAAIESLNDAASLALWPIVGGASLFAASNAPVWRISIPPASAVAVAGTLRKGPVSTLYFDWAGGLIWAEDATDGLDSAAAIRGAIAATGGHATLMRGSPHLRGSIRTFQPLTPGVAKLAQRLKAQFDPFGIFNPGRMGAAPQ